MKVEDLAHQAQLDHKDPEVKQVQQDLGVTLVLQDLQVILSWSSIQLCVHCHRSIFALCTDFYEYSIFL